MGLDDQVSERFPMGCISPSQTCDVANRLGKSIPWRTYRGIDDAVACEAWVLVQSVVGLAEGYARAAACDGAGVDWGEAFEEGAGPRRGARWVGDA